MALVALLVVLLGLPSPTAGGSTNSGPARKASLQIVAMHPLTVRGQAFRPSERVRVSANGVRKTLVAGRRGGFIVTFRRAGACGAVVVARGSEGSRASVSFDFSNVHCLELEP